MELGNGLYAVVGVIVGACVSAIGYFVRTREERLRNLRRCLFALLEIWNDLRRSSLIDLDMWINTFLNEAEKRYPGEQVTAEAEALYKNLLRPYVAELLSMLPTSSSQQNQEIFAAAINTLSQEEPLLAYKLNGRQDLKATLSALDQYCLNAQRVLPTLVSDPNAGPFYEALVGNLNRASVKETIADLEKDILAISVKARCHRDTRDLIALAHTDDKKVMAKAVTKILDEIESAARKTNT